MKKFIILFFVLLFQINIKAQNSFELLIDYNHAQRITTILVDDEDNYLVSALDFISNDEYNSILTTISTEGEIINTLFIDENGIKESILDVIALGNNEFITLGTIYNINTNENFLWIMKIDNELNIIWDKKILIENKLMRINSKHNSDNQIIFYGMAVNTGYNNFIGKISLSGELLNLKFFENYINAVNISDILEKHGGAGFYAFWITHRSEIAVLDNNFDLQSTIDMPLLLNDNGTNSFWFSDSTYILSGRDTQNTYDLAVAIVDTLHNPVYSHIIEFDSFDFLGFWDNLSFIEKDNIFLAGTLEISFNSYDTVSNWMVVEKLNDTLGLKWQKLIGGNANYNVTNIVATKDGGCIIGATRSDNTTDYDMYFIKLDANGNFVGINEESQPLKISELLIYPNPATDFLNIRLGAHLKNVTFEIYDISGKLLLTQNLENTETQINISELNSGTYIYKCFDKERVIETGKFCKK